MSKRSWFARADLGGAIVGGLVSAVAMFGAVIAVGRVGDFRALRIIEAVLPTTRFLASTAIGAGVTVLALLLTLIGLSLNVDIEFHSRLYRRARVITVLSIVAIVMGSLLLLAVTMPIDEVEDLTAFYDVLYYILATSTAVLGGVMVTIGLMISATLLGLIELAHPDGSNELMREDELESNAPAPG